MVAFDTSPAALAMVVLTGIASGIVPFVNAEVYVVALGSMAPRPLLPLLLVIATLSHMLGKALLYWAGHAAERLPEGRFTRRLAAARAKFDERTTLGGALVFVSAAVGLPPFYVLTVACGVLGYSFRWFFVLGFAGRLLRFGALILMPELSRQLTR
jgi:membrane protein YqaA with SNARE-associated domain